MAWANKYKTLLRCRNSCLAPRKSTEGPSKKGWVSWDYFIRLFGVWCQSRWFLWQKVGGFDFNSAMVSFHGDVVYWLLRGLYVAIKACTKIILWVGANKEFAGVPSSDFWRWWAEWHGVTNWEWNCDVLICLVIWFCNSFTLGVI